jgi:hypothetical protein
MSISEYFSADARTSRVKERAEKRASRRADFKKRDKEREKSGGLSFRKVGGALRDVGLGVLGLTPKDKARARQTRKATPPSSGYSASGYAAGSVGGNSGALVLGGLAAAAALAYALGNKKAD